MTSQPIPKNLDCSENTLESALALVSSLPLEQRRRLRQHIDQLELNETDNTDAENTMSLTTTDERPEDTPGRDSVKRETESPSILNDYRNEANRIKQVIYRFDSGVSVGVHKHNFTENNEYAFEEIQMAVMLTGKQSISFHITHKEEKKANNGMFPYSVMVDCDLFERCLVGTEKTNCISINRLEEMVRTINPALKTRCFHDFWDLKTQVLFIKNIIERSLYHLVFGITTYQAL